MPPGATFAADVGGMDMSMSQGHSHHMAMAGGMAMGAGHGGTNILPSWAAVLITLVYIAIVAIHALHLRDSAGQRRVWHSGHVLMALGMAFMFAPASIDTFHIPAGFWQIVFADAALATVAWIAAQALAGRPVNMLWLLMAVDMAAMAYMWSPSGFVAPLTWVLVAYFALQALLWASNRMRDIDHRTLFGGRVVLSPAVAGTTGGGTEAITIASAEPLVCFRDLRVSMGLMTLGMAYMFAAMQLLLG